MDISSLMQMAEKLQKEIGSSQEAAAKSEKGARRGGTGSRAQSKRGQCADQLSFTVFHNYTIVLGELEHQRYI